MDALLQRMEKAKMVQLRVQWPVRGVIRQVKEEWAIVLLADIADEAASVVGEGIGRIEVLSCRHGLVI